MAKVARTAAAWRAYREVSKPGAPGLGARLKAIPKMIGAVMRGTYPGMTKSKLATMGLAVLYMISPIDVIPEFLLVVGVVDDFGVFLWLMSSLLGESGRYVDWERTHTPRRPLAGHAE